MAFLQKSFAMFKLLSRSETVQSSLIYTAGGMLQRFVPFLLLPIFTRILTPADYGYLALFTTTQEVLKTLFLLGQNSAISRFYYEKEVESKAQLNTMGLIVSLFSVLIAGPIFLSLQMIPTLNIGYSIFTLFLLIYIAFGGSIETQLLAYYQISKKPYKYVAVNILNIFIGISLSLYFVFSLKLGWMGRIYPVAIYITFILGFYLLFIVKHAFRNINIRLGKDMLLYGVGLLPGALSGWGLNMIDRLFLFKLTGAELTGIYNIGYQFGFIVFVFTGAVSRAWLPYFYDNFINGGEPGKVNIRKASKAIIIGITLITTFVSIAGPTILKLMVPPEFYGATSYIGWIAIGYGVAGLQMCFVVYITYYKKTFLLSGIAIISVIANIILNMVLIPPYGPQGAAIATLCSFMISLLLYMTLAFKLNGTTLKYLLSN